MKKNMKLATVITLVATVAYAMYLMVLSHMGKLPVEKTLVVLDSKWQIDLPFQVSYWWNLLLSPIMLIGIAYCNSMDEIIGEEPNAWKNEKINAKYRARVPIFVMTCMAFVFFLGMTLLPAIFSPFSQSLGPLCGLIWGVTTALIVYVVLGAIVSVPYFLFVTGFPEKTSAEIYMLSLVGYVKMGIIKTFPFMVGLTVGFMCRFVIEGAFKLVMGVIKGIRIAFKEEAVAI